MRFILLCRAFFAFEIFLTYRTALSTFAVGFGVLERLKFRRDDRRGLAPGSY